MTKKAAGKPGLRAKKTLLRPTTTICSLKDKLDFKSNRSHPPALATFEPRGYSGGGDGGIGGEGRLARAAAMSVQA